MLVHQTSFIILHYYWKQDFLGATMNLTSQKSLRLWKVPYLILRNIETVTNKNKGFAPFY